MVPPRPSRALFSPSILTHGSIPSDTPDLSTQKAMGFCHFQQIIHESPPQVESRQEEETAQSCPLGLLLA